MNRRDLLRLITITAANAQNLTASGSAAAGTNSTGRRLVLVELAGANDGLNTLVPVSNDNYHKYRPTISLSNKEVITLDDEFSLHHSLQPLMKLWEQSNMAWVHGLGYPLANRSHFKSMALWETGGDGHAAGKQGWLTHDIEHRLGRTIIDAHGISLSGDMNLFSSNSGRWLSMTSPEQFLVNREPSTIKTTVDNESLKLVSKRMAELEQSLYGLSIKLDNTPAAKRLPGGELGAQLQQVIRLIRAGVDTPVFRVQLTGFDTHENQSYKHRELLSELADSLGSFATELQQDGEWSNTLVMTYSEFGRRDSENISAGTDHGTAAPHLLLGGSIIGGLYGTPTDLSNISNDTDPEYTMDYRALYTRVLQQWFGIKNNSFSKYNDKRLNELLT